MSKSIRTTLTELLSTDSSRAVADLAVLAVGSDQKAFDVIMDLCFKTKYPLNMRAARVLALCADKHPELIKKYTTKVTDLIINSTTGGVKRGIMKAVIDCIDIEEIPDSGLLVDHCFKIILDSSEDYAHRVYAMEIVYKTCLFVPELKDELRQTLELIDEDSPPSIKARSSIILKKLRKI